MHAPCFPEPAYNEAIHITRNPSNGLIVLKLELGRIDEAATEEMLALLTFWWLRWIGTLDCAFFQCGDTWQLQCQIDHTNLTVLPQVLRDVLAIKNTGFI